MEQTNQLQRQQNSIAFEPEQIKLIKTTIAKDATDDELKLFLYQCGTTGLNPLARQIYFMKRGGKVSIQVSIDGFRVIAERSGSYAGQDEPVFIVEGEKLVGAKVAVYKFSPSGNRYQAAVGVAYWDEYCPVSGQDFMWKKMPRTMIAKVAEALALRKAFPQDLSGLYTMEEMDQSDMKMERPAEQWQIDAVEQKLEISNLPDNQRNQLRLRIANGLTETEANKALSYLDEYIDTEFRGGAKEINQKVKAKLADADA